MTYKGAKKKIYLLLFLFVFCIQGWSEPIQLVVHAKSGSEVRYALSEKPVVTYRGDVLILMTESTTVEYPLVDLQKFTFEETADAVESVRMDQPKGDGTVRIHNVSGTLVRTIQPSENNGTNARFSTQDLPAGIYIIKQGTQTYKIRKK